MSLTTRRESRDRKLISCIKESVGESYTIDQTLVLIKEKIGEEIDRNHVKQLRRIITRLWNDKLTMPCKYCYRNKVPVEDNGEGVLDCCFCHYHIAPVEDLLEVDYWQ